MATTRHHLNLRGALVAAAVLAALAATAPSTADAYGWPVKPFDRQHPVRGFFGDPRIAGDHGQHRSFHFGVDVSAPDGTAVYATLTGTALIDPATPEVVYIRSASDPDVVFAYWHVVPAVRDGQPVTAYRAVLGHIARGWAHVHFAEVRKGRHLNPLRPGAMSPYTDRTRPDVHTVRLERRAAAAAGSQAARGTFDLVAEISDETPLPVPGRWFGRPVMPALVRWRLRRADGDVQGWRTAVDFRAVIPRNDLFGSVYDRLTRQNRPWRDGRYRILLARSWSAALLRRGLHVVDVVVADTRGNSSRRSFALIVR
jgi:hypothetical protein